MLLTIMLELRMILQIIQKRVVSYDLINISP